MNKLLSIDLLRAFAAFAVFYYHQHLGVFLAKYTHLDFLTHSDKIGATYAVPLFFLLSGFCIHLSCLKQLIDKKPLSLKDYYLNRFFRIYPAYIFTLLFSIIVIAITTTNLKISTSDFLVHLFIAQGFFESYFNTINLVLWTITVEVMFYLIYPLYYYLNKRLNSHQTLLISLLITSISILWFSTSEYELTLPQQFSFTNLWFGWCFGAWLCDQYFREPKFFKSIYWTLTVGIIISLFFSLQFISFKNDILLKNIVYILVWGPFLILFIQQEKYLAKVKRWLTIPVAIGLSSYSLYLLHVPLISIKNFLINNFIPQNYQSLTMIIGTLLIPIICFLNYKLVEIPFIKMKKNLIKKT